MASRNVSMDLFELTSKLHASWLFIDTSWATCISTVYQSRSTSKVEDFEVCIIFHTPSKSMSLPCSLPLIRASPIHSDLPEPSKPWSEQLTSDITCYACYWEDRVSNINITSDHLGDHFIGRLWVPLLSGKLSFSFHSPLMKLPYFFLSSLVVQVPLVSSQCRCCRAHHHHSDSDTLSSILTRMGSCIRQGNLTCVQKIVLRFHVQLQAKAAVAQLSLTDKVGLSTGSF